MNIYENLIGVEDPYYFYDARMDCASVEFLAVSNDAMYEDFASRTSLIEDSEYNDFAELLKSDDYLNIYITVYEDGFVDAVIGISGGGDSYCVSLSDEEQKSLRTFIYDYCDTHLDKRLTTMFREAYEAGDERERVREEFDCER